MRADGWDYSVEVVRAGMALAYISNEVGASIAVIEVATSTVLNTFALPEGSLPYQREAGSIGR